MQILFDDVTIVFNVQYSKRKSFALEVTSEGHITLKAPSKSPEAAIMAFMTTQKKDLLAYQKRLEGRKFIKHVKTYDETAHFLYMGKACTLTELFEEIPPDEEAIQVALKKLYTKKTKQYVKKRVAYYEKIIGVKAKSLTVVDSPASWGTCNNFKDLTFNYKLSMAPPHVIDYVVVHELCHILHLNHDRSFWRKVGMYDPEFKANQAYLSRFGGVMTI